MGLYIKARCCRISNGVVQCHDYRFTRSQASNFPISISRPMTARTIRIRERSIWRGIDCKVAQTRFQLLTLNFLQSVRTSDSALTNGDLSSAVVLVFIIQRYLSYVLRSRCHDWHVVMSYDSLPMCQQSTSVEQLPSANCHPIGRRGHLTLAKLLVRFKEIVP